MLEDVNIQYAYLSSYSPDLNPIEEAFVELKSWMKRHRKLSEDLSDLGEFVDLALQSLKDDDKEHFHKAFVSESLCEGSEEDYWDD